MSSLQLRFWLLNQWFIQLFKINCHRLMIICTHQPLSSVSWLFRSLTAVSTGFCYLYHSGLSQIVQNCLKSRQKCPESFKTLALDTQCVLRRHCSFAEISILDFLNNELECLKSKIKWAPQCDCKHQFSGSTIRKPVLKN